MSHVAFVLVEQRLLFIRSLTTSIQNTIAMSHQPVIIRILIYRQMLKDHPSQDFLSIA